MVGVGGSIVWLAVILHYSLITYQNISIEGRFDVHVVITHQIICGFYQPNICISSSSPYKYVSEEHLSQVLSSGIVFIPYTGIYIKNDALNYKSQKTDNWIKKWYDVPAGLLVNGYCNFYWKPCYIPK